MCKCDYSTCTNCYTKYRERLENRLKELHNQDLDEQRLLTEVAIFAERCDIHEELVRLQSHLEQFRETLQIEEPVGRKMDFIVQEMHREINTIGSKANDLTISKYVVEMKNNLEKFVNKYKILSSFQKYIKLYVVEKSDRLTRRRKLWPCGFKYWIRKYCICSSNYCYCKSGVSSIKRTVQEAREHNALLDATYGRKQGRLLLWMMGMLY